MRAAISTLGCRANQYDSSAMEEALRLASIEVVPFPSPADAYIINTCTVTGRTDRQSRQEIRKARRANPGAVVIVTGCFAQVSPEEVLTIEGVDYVLGNPEKGRIIEYILSGRRGSALKATGRWQDGTPLTLRARGSSGRTRANLKIQEGCDRSCTYCVIPRARGLSKSLTLEEVDCEISALAASGYREAVLTGIHLGAYGADLNPAAGLTAVLELIEKKGYGMRFRLSSLDPDEVTEELVEILSGARHICNHLHLPLQSGDDRILKAMKRPYTAALFADRVERLARSVRDISIGVDVMAGFPGEGETEFANTRALLSDLPLSYLHVFPFSKRKGAPASGFPGQVSARALRERADRLRELDAAKRKAFVESFAGSRGEALIEYERDAGTGLLKGRTRNYIQAYLEGGPALHNKAVGVELTSPFMDGMLARAVKTEAA